MACSNIRTMPYRMPEDERDRVLLRSFGVQLRRCRLMSGLSQVVLAERSGVSQSTISRLERGVAPAASVYKLVLLGAVLGVRLPLAFCPHHHHCSWRPLREDGTPDRRREPIADERYYLSLLDEGEVRS